MKRGKEIFTTHAAGQCAKCHKVNGDGGVASPELTGIGSKQDHEYLLASLVDPSSVVVPGYGMMMVTLKNGESIGGALLEETAEKVVLKSPIQMTLISKSKRRLRCQRSKPDSLPSQQCPRWDTF